MLSVAVQLSPNIIGVGKKSQTGCYGYTRYLKEELCALLHDLLDLQEACGVHEEELVPYVHAEAACVAEGQDLLEALGLDGRGELHHTALPSSVEQVPEVGATGRQDRPVRLGRDGERK